MHVPSRAKPEPLPTTQPYWEAAKRGELAFQRCGSCSTAFLYPRICCPACGSSELVWEKASGRATLYSYVINYLAAPGFQDAVPHVIAIVKLAEGPQMLSNIVGVPPVPEHLKLDMLLELAFEDRGGQPLPVFRPIGSAA